MDLSPALRTPEEPGKWSAAALAGGMHLLLAALLFWGVRWQTHQPEAFEVDLVRREASPAAAVAPPPRPAEPAPAPAPKPPETAPEPPKPQAPPDIALPEPKPKKDKPKPEAPPERPVDRKPAKPVQPEAEPDLKAQAAAEQRRLNAMLERERLQTQLKAEAGRVADARARASADRELDAYRNRIRVKVRGNIVLPPTVEGNPEALFRVKQLPTGELLDVQLVRSSGNATLDAAVERAIRKSSPLPLPDDPSLFRRELEIPYRPFDTP